MFPYNFITIEGNIGSGKTSFCKMIHEETDCRMILEQFDDNPFLPFFYDDMERFALTVELFFMTERMKQLQKNLLYQDLFQSFTIADYTFVKTLLFARKNLGDEEYRIFQKLFNTLNSAFPNPDLLVYFHRSVDVLQMNIAKRGREYEKKISDQYLLKIQNSYFEYFRNILTFPVLIIDLNEIDFVANPKHYEHIKFLLKKQYNPGVHRVSLFV
ncbi:deoxynucleoside kinase [Portibacter marinus]|uniref:deoxynucleoside kinase n=1 Tax=Portibacter marinus TaxID=2898660 RepID=UPI001F2EDA2B|nr:deoxynucleoside kinase [Portibacter marinus]